MTVFKRCLHSAQRSFQEEPDHPWTCSHVEWARWHDDTLLLLFDDSGMKARLSTRPSSLCRRRPLEGCLRTPAGDEEGKLFARGDGHRLLCHDLHRRGRLKKLTLQKNYSWTWSSSRELDIEQHRYIFVDGVGHLHNTLGNSVDVNSLLPCIGARTDATCCSAAVTRWPRFVL